MRQLNPQIKKLHPQYEGLELSTRDAMLMSEQGDVQLWHRPSLPFYVEVGNNLLRFTSVDSDHQQALFAERLDDTGQPMTQCLFTNGRTEIGRVTTPELELDKTASRRHLGLLVMTSAVQVRDLQSTNGSTLYAAPNAIAEGHFTTLWPLQQS